MPARTSTSSTTTRSVRMLGRRMDQVRDEDDETGPPVEQARDEPVPGPTEQP
jgi:hypothetical protein